MLIIFGVIGTLFISLFVVFCYFTDRVHQIEFWSLGEEHEYFDFPGQKTACGKIGPGVYQKTDVIKRKGALWIYVTNNRLGFSIWVKVSEGDHKLFIPKKTVVRTKNGKKKVVITHIDGKHIWGYVGTYPSRSIIHINS